MKFLTISRNLCHFPNFSGTFWQNFQTFCHFLNISVKFRQKFINIAPKKSEKSSKTRDENEISSFHSGKKFDDFLLKFRNLSGAKVCTSCRSRKMLKNEPIPPRWGKKNGKRICVPQKKSFGKRKMKRKSSGGPRELLVP